MIKIEEDTTEFWQDRDNERDFLDEQQFDVDSIKMEPNLGKLYGHLSGKKRRSVSI